ncbi:MAG: O-antigen ligase family protein, partial [Gaiellaceae bacterium]
DRGPVVASTVVVAALGVLSLTVLTGYPVLHVIPVVILSVVAAVGYRSLLSWRSLVTLVVLVILLVPIRRYRLPGDLPFELEPYRIIVALIVAAWLSSLLIDPRVWLKRSGFEWPLLLFAAATVGSVLVNPERARAVEDDVVKELMFFGSFLLVFYIIVSVGRPLGNLDRIVKVMLGGGAVVAALALIESRTGFNLFDRFSGVIPLLELNEAPDIKGRGGRLRVYASSQHPIALGAAFVMLIPLAIYMVRQSGKQRWWLVGGLLMLGAVATVSRTSILMLIVVGLVFLWLRPRETKRLWPALIPVVLVVHIALPGTIGSLKSAFFPPGGLIAEQQTNAGQRGSGRIADLGPALREYAQRPLLGQGYGTRIVDAERQNAPILDNQWLGSLLETGIVGVFALGWLFVRVVRRLG